MIVLSNSEEVTVAAGQPVIFDTVVSHTGKGECHRPNTGSVKMCCQGIYELHFSGNITGDTAATPVQLQLQTTGVNLPETIMIAVPAAAGDLVNVGTETLYRNMCCDFDRVSVVNTGTEPVTIGAGSAFFVKRVA